MRRAATTLMHSIKDQIRGVRYSLRAEAEVPGSALPKVLREIDFGPLAVIGSVVGTPAVRLADELMAQVETVASGLMVPAGAAVSHFPSPVTTYFGRAPGDGSALANGLYEEVKGLLRRHGVRNMLVSEHALDLAWSRVSARHGDALPSGSATGTDDVLVRACAGMSVAFNDVRPIQKVSIEDAAAAKQHFMLAPNLYCGLVIGLATAVVTLHPEAGEDRDGVIDSADSAVDARFGRFKRAVSGKDPVGDLAAEFAAILPYLP